MNKPEYLILHHTAVSRDKNKNQLQAVNTYHKSKDFYLSSLGYYVGYHYFIEPSGKVIQTRKHTDIGCHTVGCNATSIGICLAGNFNQELPTKEQCDSLRDLVNRLSSELDIPQTQSCIAGHKEFQDNRTCPGVLLKDSFVMDLLKEYPNDIVDDEKAAMIKQVSILKQIIETLKQLLSLTKK